MRENPQVEIKAQNTFDETNGYKYKTHKVVFSLAKLQQSQYTGWQSSRAGKG